MKKIYLSISTKMFLFTMMPFVLMIIIISILSIQHRIEDERELTSNRIESYITLLESGDLSFNSIKHKEKIEKLLNEKVLSVELIKRDGSIAFTTGSPEYEINKEQIDKAFQGYIITFTRQNKIPVLISLHPIIVKNTVVGILHLELSFEKSNDRIRQYTLFVLFLNIFGIILSFVLIYFLSKNIILNRLKSLTDMCSEIRRGNLNHRISIKSHDELGRLALTFNDTTEELAERNQQLKEEKQKVLDNIRKLEKQFAMRRQAEKALIKTKEQYRILAEQAGQIMYDYNIATGKIAWSGDIRPITGCTPEEFQKVDISKWEKLIHSDDRKAALTLLDEAMKKCSNFHVEYRFKQKDETYLYVEDNGLFLGDEKGNAYQMLGIMKDITKRKQAEEELRKSENQYKYLYRMVRLMCDNLPDLIWTKDLDNKYIFTNKACCEKLLNASDTNEPIGKTDIYFSNREKESHPENPDYHTFGATCTGSDLAVLKSKKPRKTDEFGNVKGKFLYLDVYKAPFWEEKGNIIGTVGCAKDITKEKQLEEEHKQAEEKLLKSEIKYKTLYDSSMDAIMIITMEQGYISGNSASVKMFGCKDEKDFISKNPWNLSPEYQPDGALSSVKAQEVMKIAMEKGSHSFDWKHKRINGQEFFASVLLNRLELQGKEILQATVRDITGRKRAEDRIKHLNGVLNAIRNVNQLILVEKDKDRLLQKSCDALIDARDYDLAWLGLLRDDNKFTSVISSGMGKDIKHFKEKVMSGDHPPCVKRALIRKNHLIVVDKSKECENCFVKNTCEGKETAIIHVEHGGSLFGLLTVSLRSGVSIDDEEKELLKEVAGDIAFALYNMDLEKARWQAEVALRQSEERLRIKLEYILSPDEDVKDVFLTDLVDLKDLQQIQDAFAAANDVASIISDVDGKPITKPSNFCGVCEIIRSTKKGNKNCIKSDKILGKKAKAFMKPIYEECHSCGFIDASAPIIVGGKHIANWLIGQSNIMGVDKHRIETYAKEIDADKNKMLSAFKKMPEMSLAKFEERLDLLWIMAKEISTLGYSNIILAKDITELKKAEDRLQKAHEELEIRVKERTTDLQTANKELEAFSYSVSHDLRAPLRAIDGFSQILLEDYVDILDEEGQRYLQRVRAGTQNMGKLIDDILNLSRIGRQPMVKEIIKLENIAKETYKSLKNEWKDRKVNFSVRQCQAAQADSRLMQIVFTNLLSNALKFTRNKKAAKIETGCQINDTQTVFYVKDNGAGFDMKYVDKLFSPFQRLHRAEDYEGTGIGLAIVKRIIDRHGGRIWVESKSGSGTTFYFTL